MANEALEEVREFALIAITELRDGAVLTLQNHLYNANNTVEMLQSFVNVLDKIMDGTSRPQDFWLENLPPPVNFQAAEDVLPVNSDSGGVPVSSESSETASGDDLGSTATTATATARLD
ncbi:unnamed protein product [Cochlearia groenlandica]